MVWHGHTTWLDTIRRTLTAPGVLFLLRGGTIRICRYSLLDTNHSFFMVHRLHCLDTEQDDLYPEGWSGDCAAAVHLQPCVDSVPHPLLPDSARHPIQTTDILMGNLAGIIQRKEIEPAVIN